MLDGLEKKTRGKVARKAVRAGAKLMAKEVRRRCPVDTGELRKHIKVRAPKGRRKKDRVSSRVVVGADMHRRGKPIFYVAPFEYGSYKFAAHPFIRPGFAASVHPASGAVAAEMRAGIRAALRSR